MATREQAQEWGVLARKRLTNAAGLATTSGLDREEILAIVTAEIDTWWGSHAATLAREALARDDSGQLAA